MSESIQIIKIGGKIINDNTLLDQFLQSFNKIKGKKLLVHGGGRAATAFSERLGLKVNMIDGRRVTDKETLDIAVMTYAGLINKQIVSKMQHLGINAIGLSGADANVIESVMRSKQPIDYGFVGDIIQVNANLIHALLDQNLVPVFCPVTHSKKGQLLNTNADSIASAVAKAMSQKADVVLKYCFEYNGVLENLDDADSIIQTVTKRSATQYIDSGVFADGMIPKVENAFKALDAGIKSVHICGIGHVHKDNPGTSFIHDNEIKS
jgi:acetylglutamate kinase